MKAKNLARKGSIWKASKMLNFIEFRLCRPGAGKSPPKCIPEARAVSGLSALGFGPASAGGKFRPSLA
jgi:hypothetical protein